MKERIIYECEHCNKKRLFSKGAMKNHEARCWWNLENKTCVTCWHDGGWHNNEKPYRSCHKGIESDGPRPKMYCEHWKSFDDGLYEEEGIK